MNYDKIQVDILKAAYSHKMTLEGYMVEDDNVIVLDNKYAVIIPKDSWYLDTNKVFNNRPPMRLDLKKFTDNADQWLKDTGMSKRTPDGKGTLHIFVNEQDEKIYIDERLLKIFQNDKYDKLSYRGSTYNAPVILYDDMVNCLGLILPVVI